MNALQKKLNETKNKDDSAAIRNQINKTNNELQEYRENFVRKNPDHILSAVFMLLKDPVGTPSDKHPGGRYDSAYAYQYFKSHFWDGVSFTDERLVRTPVLQPRLEKVFGEVLQQQPDTLIKAADKILEASKSNKEMFKYILSFLTDRYVNPKYMGQDAVFVYLFQKFYVTGEADEWMCDKYKKFVFDRVYSLMANVIGYPAANLHLLDRTG